MARLIVKSPYIKCGTGQSAGGYLKYIATRERVEIIPDDRPPTNKQTQLIAKLVKDFPDAKELMEYEDYLSHPTKATASALITLTLESNWDRLSSMEGYAKYIALRPRAERLGEHGLFGDDDDVDLSRVMDELDHYTGNVWTHIISLHREDAERLGYDNSLMELVRHTVEFIKRKPYGNKLLIKVKDEVKLVIDATSEYEPCDRQKIIEQNKKNTVRHAYFREYLALQRLCLLILQHQKHQIGAGARQIYGILFDGAWLWEEYVNSLIEDVFYHPMNKGGKGAQRLFDGNVGLIYPDFISRNSETRIIADAKYKPVDNIGNRDYLQVLAYMFRFDAKTGYYLYPEAEGSDDLKLRMNCGSTYEKNVMPRDDISLTKHGLKIPVDALNYAEFSVRMKTCEQEFKSALIF